MARPQKETVDYFPHSCNHKKTMFILEERYGNDGYAFWFKLLEILGSAKGHYVDLSGPSEMEFLLAKTHLSEVSATEMLDLLAKLGAIDPEAWSHKAIWCQNFVDGVASVYQSRHQPLPQKPSCLAQKPTPTEVIGSRNPQGDDVSLVNNPQTIGNYSRVEKSIYSPIPEESDNVHDIKKDTRREILDHWNEKEIIKHRSLTDKLKRAINGALANCSRDEIVQAIDNYSRVLQSPDHYFKYRWTLNDFLQRGLDKFMDWRVADDNYKKTPGNGGTARALPKRTEYTPTPNYPGVTRL